MNIKLVIASLFVLTIISAVVGVAIYYESLSPIRLVSRCSKVGDVLDKVTYLEYNVSDMQGNKYVIKVDNNPSTRSGTVEMYSGGNLVMKVEYKYEDRLKYIKITYQNGTNKTYQGLDASKYEEPFYTSINLQYNQSSGAANISVFPGVGPLYLPCFVGKAAQINWKYYASLVKPRNLPYGLVDVSINFGKTKYKGQEINAVVVQITRRGAIQNKWILPVYNLALADMNGVPVAVSMSVDVLTPQGGGTLIFHVLDLKTAG